MLEYCIYNTNIYNSIAFLLGVGVVAILLYCLKFGAKKTILYTCLCIPACYFNSFFLSDAVTADEQTYIPIFSNLGTFSPDNAYWLKVSLQYRFSQSVFGSIFRFIRILFPNISSTDTYILYKIIHWYIFILIAFFIVYIWGKYIITQKNTLTYRLSILGIFYCLVGLPVCCLILKVSNYDAGNVFFAVLAFSLSFVFAKSNDIKFAVLAGVTATFGCMEKWTSLIYFMIVVAIVTFLVLKSKYFDLLKKCDRFIDSYKCIFKMFFTGTGMIFAYIVGACIQCMLFFAWTRILSGNGFVDMNIGLQLFPMIFFIRTFMGRGDYIITDAGYYDSGIINYLLVEFILIVFSICLLIALWFINDLIWRKKHFSCIPTITALLGLILIFSGVMGSYLLIRKVYPFVDIPYGVFQPEPSSNGVVYFYGANNYFMHTIYNCVFANAMVISCMPTVMILSFVLCAILLMLCIRKNSTMIFLSLTYILISMILLPVFTLAGQPACPRYFGVSIIMVGVCSVFLCSELSLDIENNILARNKGGIIALLFIFYCAEMYSNFPLYNCFRPFWLVRDDGFMNGIRQGEWDASEAMTWGEDLALAGYWIEKYCEENSIDIHDVTIVCDYGINWYTNPGFELVPYPRWLQDNRACDENTFFVFVKFRRYREPIPEFISETEALNVIRINGEATAWIYEGNQLTEYFDNSTL